jgi:hypothetical protein
MHYQPVAGIYHSISTLLERERQIFKAISVPLGVAGVFIRRQNR